MSAFIFIYFKLKSKFLAFFGQSTAQSHCTDVWDAHLAAVRDAILSHAVEITDPSLALGSKDIKNGACSLKEVKKKKKWPVDSNTASGCNSYYQY